MMIMFIIIIFIFIFLEKNLSFRKDKKDTTSGVKSGVTEAAGGRSCGRKVEVPVFAESSDNDGTRRVLRSVDMMPTVKSVSPGSTFRLGMILGEKIFLHFIERIFSTNCE